jgi:hypothetical protein
LLPHGHHLYPAMPYPSYAKITDEDAESALDVDQYVKQKSPILQRILAQAGMTPEELLKIEHVNRAS